MEYRNVRDLSRGERSLQMASFSVRQQRWFEGTIGSEVERPTTALMPLLWIVVLYVGISACEKPAPTMSLLEAAIVGNIEEVKANIAVGAPLNAMGKEPAPGWAPLHAAVSRGHKEIVELLLDAGAEVNLLGSKDDIPLHLAVLWSDEELVRLLLSRGANVNQRTRQGYTALHTAATLPLGDASGDRLAITKMLVDAGADLNAKAENGITPLQFARDPQHPDPRIAAFLEQAITERKSEK